ncbi:transcriptional regulator [Comamonas nitrativorans]|uniref:Transcriptional regulator n=1 Tax=Comamonas nitrativorans TaxID=108437 RepID=A0ABV9GS60_9BURK
MELKNFIKTLTAEEREGFASRCGTTYAFLRNVVYGHRRAGESLCINIERESAGSVTCEELRPDVDWAYLRGTSSATTKEMPHA